MGRANRWDEGDAQRYDSGGQEQGGEMLGVCDVCSKLAELQGFDAVVALGESHLDICPTCIADITTHRDYGGEGMTETKEEKLNRLYNEGWEKACKKIAKGEYGPWWQEAWEEAQRLKGKK